MNAKTRLTMIIMYLALFICFPAIMSAEGTAENPPKVLRVGILPAESAIPIILSQEHGVFAEENVEVKIIPFNSPNDRNVAFQAGQIDGFIGDIMTAVTMYNAGFPVVMTSDINEDFKLLTAPGSGIASFDDLDGKDVSLIPGFVLEYIMDKMAEREHISYSAVVIPSIPARFEALLKNQIAAVLFTEPQASLLAARGAHILAGSKDYGIAAGAMIFSKDAVESKTGEISAFYRACDTTIDAINGNDLSEYVPILSDYGFPEAISGKIDYSPAEAVDEAAYRSVIAWMKEKNDLKEEIPFQDIIYSY